MTWHTGRLAGFDTETTSVDPETARIVTGALVLADNGQRVITRTWLTDAGGEDIPNAATAVHGITTSQAHTEGQPMAEAVREIVAVLVDLIRGEVPIVAMNARYDLTLLDREMLRLGMPPLAELAGRDPIVLDPLVMDKQADPYRKGKRTLTALCDHYRIQLSHAHSAAADALAAVQVVHRLAELSPNARSYKPATLHQMQVDWAAEQAASLQDYLRRRDPAAVVDGRWPLIPRQEGTR